MKPVLAGWQVSDTIISESEPAKTWVVIVAEDKEEGRWIEIENTPDCVSLKGTRGMRACESIFVRMGFHAFRESD